MIVTGYLLFFPPAFSAAQENEGENISKDVIIEYADENENIKENAEGRETKAEKKGSGDQQLYKIIVTADRQKKSSGDISLPSAVVDHEEITEKMYTGMADLLEDTPGFSRVYDYHSPFILRGVSGTKMLVLRDGSPVFSSFPGGFMGQNVNIYDVDRVEVIRGPGSVIYGSGATSGIINIINRDNLSGRGFWRGRGCLVRKQQQFENGHGQRPLQQRQLCPASYGKISQV